MNLELQDLLMKLGNEAHMRVHEENRINFLKHQACKLDLKKFSIPIFSVTGTNGKGSTVEVLKTIYKSSNYKVGVFTSPHLISYNERIRINDCMISNEDLIDGLHWILKEDKENELSFFERLFFVAWRYFTQQNVDILILEVGLGGRLDATNVLDADLVIVTTVDFDHQNILGDTIEKIAYEKSGLFKLNKKAIYADAPVPNIIVEQAKNLNIDLKICNRDYFIEVYDQKWTLRFQNKFFEFSQLPSIHISAFACGVVASLFMQDSLPVSESTFYDIIGQVSIVGRRQWIKDYSLAPILLDVAHNPQAVYLLAHEIEKTNIKGKVYCLFSALKDKDCSKIIQTVNKDVFLWYTCPLKSERSSDQVSMNTIFNHEALCHEWFESSIEAFKAINSKASPEDLIVVFGSFFLVGEIMNYIQLEGKHVF